VPAVGNLDTDALPPNVGNPEIFLYNVGTSTFTQVTNTKSTSFNNPIFSENPVLSGNGSVIAFSSNSNLLSTNDDGGGFSNAEIYVANFNPATGAVSGLRQATKTKNGIPSATPTASPDPTTTAVLLSFGRRMSRDGGLSRLNRWRPIRKPMAFTTFYAPYL
jgi:Tol biopolymer transport system component